ncbi:MAG: ornithine--oxo-acid transaminase [Clostridiales bacterium]|jgi:ornithine--oxo-acid transaminase|nr:ornithine--oxo-acid transaminase [Clostridiales bacterium]
MEKLSSQQIIETTEKYGAHNYKPKEVVFSQAGGVEVTNPEGRLFYDMLSAYSAHNFGHRHPEIIQALKDQLDLVTLSSRAFYNDMLGPWMKKLCDFTGKSMVLPMNTGTEAVETALKTARRWGNFVKKVPDGRQEIICCENNFHGRSISIISMSNDENAREGFGPFAPGFKSVPYGDYAALERAITPDTCAFLIEPIQGEAGVLIPPGGFMKKAYELCKKHNVLFIADEVQTGFARTGTMFACQHEGVEPDIYIFGKALGGGVLPISAVVANEDILGVFTPGSHGSTFGGNPLACAVSLKALEILERDDYPKQAKEKGEYFIKKLREIKNGDIIEIRGRGLLIGVEFKENAAPYVKKLIENGILAKETHDCTIRFAPPIIITYEQLDDACERIKKALE